MKKMLCGFVIPIKTTIGTFTLDSELVSYKLYQTNTGILELEASKDIVSDPIKMQIEFIMGKYYSHNSVDTLITDFAKFGYGQINAGEKEDLDDEKEINIKEVHFNLSDQDKANELLDETIPLSIIKAKEDLLESEGVEIFNIDKNMLITSKGIIVIVWDL